MMGSQVIRQLQGDPTHCPPLVCERIMLEPVKSPTEIKTRYINVITLPVKALVLPHLHGTLIRVWLRLAFVEEHRCKEISKKQRGKIFFYYEEGL